MGGDIIGFFGGFDFILSVIGVGDLIGMWLFIVIDFDLVMDFNLFILFDLVGVLKVSDRYVLYFFDDILFDINNDGIW